MKNILITIAICFPLTVSAQVQKGKMPFTGQFGFSSDGRGGGKNNVKEFNLAFSQAYLVSNKVGLGLSAGYLYSDDPNSSNNSNHINAFTIGPFIRRYVPLNERFYLHFDFAFNLINVKYSSTTSKANSGGVSPGLSYFVTDKFALQAAIGGLLYTVQKGSKFSEGYLDANLGIQSLTLGAVLYLNSGDLD